MKNLPVTDEELDIWNLEAAESNNVSYKVEKAIEDYFNNLLLAHGVIKGSDIFERSFDEKYRTKLKDLKENLLDEFFDHVPCEKTFDDGCYKIYKYKSYEYMKFMGYFGYPKEEKKEDFIRYESWGFGVGTVINLMDQYHPEWDKMKNILELSNLELFNCRVYSSNILDGCTWNLKIKLNDNIYWSWGGNAWPGFGFNTLVGHDEESCIDEIVRILQKLSPSQKI